MINKGEVTFECSIHVNAQTLASTQKSFLQNIKLTVLLQETFTQVSEDKASYKKERGQEGRVCS